MKTKQNTANSTVDMQDYASTSDCVYRTPKQYQDYCPHRLPCGYCRLLMRDCPKGYTITVTW